MFKMSVLSLFTYHFVTDQVKSHLSRISNRRQPAVRDVKYSDLDLG